uniref:Putative tumor necrosis factor-mediated signaling pathway n=1 Tax=Amblyomma sculptum TaxID=1581419 RepID=A0A1E1XU32_AMBSC
MTVHKLLVKDRNNTFKGNLVTFTTEVPPSVKCSLCGNISKEMRRLPCGRLYCQPCAYMLDDDEEIECGDECTHEISELVDSDEAFQEALLLTAMCPKQGCPYQGSLEEVMDHYKSCTLSTAKCTLCGEDVAAKLMSMHVAEVCECRPQSCPYCEMEVEARNLESHMEDCDLRPANCTYCNEEFDTYLDLRDTHMDVCPNKPVKCPYQRFGCNIQVSNKEMENHLRSPRHVTLLVDRILSLEAQNRELRNENDTLKDIVRTIEDRVRTIEDKQTTEECLRANMVDSQEELMDKISELQATAMQTQPEVDARIKELEDKQAILQEPLDKLLREISGL